MNRNRWIAFFIILLVIFWLSLGSFVDEHNQMAGSTSFSSASSGVKTFRLLKEKIDAESVDLNKRPTFTDQILKGYDTLMILDPKRPISKLESKIILEFVEKGGQLILSFSSEKRYGNILPIVSSMGWSLNLVENEKYKNGTPEIIEPKELTDLWTPSQKFAVYSPYIVTNDACKYNRFYCFVYYKTIGAGRIFLFSGLPPFSNALLLHGDNSGFSIRLAKWTKKTLFDEYHHFFTEKTAKDLFVNPHFMVPAIAVFLGCLIYFLFAQSKLDWMRQTSPRLTNDKSFHKLYSSTISNIVKTENNLGSLVKLQAEYLKKQFPNESNRIDLEIKNVI